MTVMLDKPMPRDQKIRCIAVMGLVRANLLDVLEMNRDMKLVEFNKRFTEEAAGNGWPYIHVNGPIPCSTVTARLAQEMNHVILKAEQYTKKSEWMGR